MHFLLEGRIALITGGSRGLGLAIASCFSAGGAKGGVIDLPELCEEVQLPAGFEFIPGDVGDESSPQKAVTTIADRHGRLDVVVANAGLVPRWRETETLDLAEWDRVMAVNVRGVTATLKHATPALKTGGGSAILMGSINAFIAHPRQMLYTASKHAVLGIARAAAPDLNRYNIRVNGIAPALSPPTPCWSASAPARTMPAYENARPWPPWRPKTPYKGWPRRKKSPRPRSSSPAICQAASAVNCCPSMRALPDYRTPHAGPERQDHPDHRHLQEHRCRHSPRRGRSGSPCRRPLRLGRGRCRGGACRRAGGSQPLPAG